ncbi:hypothetical protein CRUP_036084 [Coryphaenoides rupestris]|nr:hypothetical protein CRUP_036084 [Coryphaenoides rupestris]
MKAQGAASGSSKMDSVKPDDKADAHADDEEEEDEEEEGSSSEADEMAAALDAELNDFMGQSQGQCSMASLPGVGGGSYRVTEACDFAKMADVVE